MLKKIVLVAPLLLLAACGDPEPKPDLVTVDNVEVVGVDTKACIKGCSWYIEVKKGETILRMDTSETIAKAVRKGTKVTVTYNPNDLKATKVTFPDFENKEEKKDVH